MPVAHPALRNVAGELPNIGRDCLDAPAKIGVDRQVAVRIDVELQAGQRQLAKKIERSLDDWSIDRQTPRTARRGFPAPSGPE
ncbi:MAG TPA: hypothetical protein VNH11_08435 [Pirellulales bacterium]|nr:hypothetical protein [Pirellulales bacterium]